MEKLSREQTSNPDVSSSSLVGEPAHELAEAYRNLKPKQRMVYDKISQSESATSAYSLLDQLHGDGFRAPTQIYRVLNQLLECRLIHRVESLNAYVACRQQHDLGNTAFTVCEKCGTVEELESAGIVERLREDAEKSKFRLKQAVVELKGQCNICP